MQPYNTASGKDDPLYKVPADSRPSKNVINKWATLVTIEITDTLF